ILGLSVSVGTMIGGAIVGVVLEHWNFTTLFIVVALLDLIPPIAGCFLEDKAPIRNRPRRGTTTQTGLVLGLSFYLLLVASTLVNASNAFVLLGRPLVMDKSGFDSAAISSVITVGGAVGIPIPLLIGWLSDRLGRYRFLVLSYLVA